MDMGTLVVEQDTGLFSWPMEVFNHSELKYRALLETVTNGYALYEVLKDQRQEPAGYIVREINPAFETLMGVTAAAIINREITDTRLSLRYTGINWAIMLKETAQDGCKRIFEKQVKLSDRWLQILVISPLAGYVAVLVTDISQQKEKLQYQSYYDLLTGLPNRRLLEDRLMLAILQAKRSREQLAVVFFDLDNFKDIVEKYGRETGSKVLIEIASRTVKSLRQSDTVARVGPESFVIVLPSIKTRTQTILVANRLLEECRRPVRVRNVEVPVSGSLHIRFLPQSADEFSGEIKKKDARLYLAKQQKYPQVSLTV